MRTAKTNGGPNLASPSAATSTNRSSSGPNRGASDGHTFPSHATGGLSLSGEASLASQDLVRQLLCIARGDLSTAVALGTADANPQCADTLSGPTAAGGRPSSGSPSDTGGGGSGSGDDAAKRDAQARTAAVRGAASLGFSSVPQPVPVRCATDNSALLQSSAPQAADGVTAISTLALPATAGSAAAREAPSCASTDAGVGAFYLTAFVARALHMEDYWVSLAHQIEVDQHVEFIQFCADAGFGTLKTIHLLQWWKQYRALVRDVRATHSLQLSDGNPQAPPPPSSPSGLVEPTSAAVVAAGGGGESNTAAVTGAAGRDAAAGGAKGAPKKGRRVSAAGGTAAAAAASDAEARAAAAASPHPSATPATAYRSHDEAVRMELQRFVQWELEHEYGWRLVPREPFSAVPSGLFPPSAGAAATASSAAGAAAAVAATGTVSSASSQAAGGKTSKADKAKMQLQQQQELELEEQRLARIAALPRENIFLTTAEVDGFVRVVVTEDLLAHAALHAYVATQACQPPHTLAHAAAAPVFFSVQVEVPMSVPPLKEATKLVAAAAAAPATATTSGTRLSGDAADGHHISSTSGTGQRSPLRPPSNAQSKPRSRGNSKPPAAAAAAAGTTATTTAAEGDRGSEELSSTLHGRPLVLSAMEALRAEQAKEAAAYAAAYAEELAYTAAQKQQAQHAADVDLFFEKSTTKTAVRAVYESMEDAVSARQQRILQRVTALEQTLGLTEGGSVEGGGAAAAAAATTTTGGKPGAAKAQ
ncbi:hypothetical protein ABB37_01877 [Leptomonas pyrrhocoris]|uniref:Uncharacterized protein n=1 Tax=Leptomonas pyrrhocoris TaxID=157538 RepID=A0A0M9G6Z2_LEPPY|nr:hypothetical protein ABB37_01877 [Leptomonas pyrrhocoris]XP_015662035.1 hypothetical protein ABB37_01877 [Leptomonas pyrrhocoris]KPA83595.1 hypothetical protein ABB37_01877 [Leptomonas pyrrhocoris]KPA83596.1 hypothetical protein ABB37_01877 [Leptomonas pyrrhocoris]|eukprot:XP_015662034.1 hypothetical protein ABB37_01877 [Leptomonas pyrrhocoris]